MPDLPGIYIYRDKNKNVIYVGKAKKLKRRVSQYFMNKESHGIKTQKLVENIWDVEYIVTDSEEEALILECNFIKRYKPKYNILLKDDKSYPYIKVTTNEEYPRIYTTRKYDKDGAKYFGPFPDVLYAKQLVEFFSNRFKLRKCKNNIVKNTSRPCLNYDMQLCMAPCYFKNSKNQYMENVRKIIEFLSGNYKVLLKEIEEDMKNAAQELNFESAAKYRDEINLVKRLSDEQKITTTENRDMDIIALASDSEDAKTLVQILTIREGKMIDRNHLLLENVINEEKEEILYNFIKQYYLESGRIPKEIMIEEELADMKELETSLSKIAGYKITINVPKIGKNKRLLMLAKSNAQISIMQYKQKSYYKEDVRNKYLMELRDLLKLEKLPARIESYDVSNIQGVDNVASMVVFVDGKEEPSQYRKFKIKSVIGANDVGCMMEVLERRFNRYLNNDSKFDKLPDLIMMDGGKNQVNAAKDIINKLGLEIDVCGLVKDDKHRTNKIFYEDVEFKIDTRSELFKFITRIQDEVHRNAIGYFKKLHNKNQLKSELDNIEQIGEKRKMLLLNKFKNIENIKKATLEDFLDIETINKNVAQNIIDYFEKMEEEDE